MRRASRHVHPRGSRTVRLTVAIIALFAVFACGAAWLALGAHDHGIHQGQPQPATRQGAPSKATRPRSQPSWQVGQGQDPEVDADLAGLRAVTAPQSPAKPIEGRIPSAYRHQPDLYARAFVERLFTQDYTTSRQAHLAWVQAESARTDEPTVTGMVPPELRDRLALFSVTDERAGPPPVSSAVEWNHLAQEDGRTTVTVQRVTEPLAWSNAVEAGRVSDPGVTAREVTALVKLTIRAGAGTTTSAISVDLTLNLVGPPTRAEWAFVTLITYRAIPMAPLS